MIELTEDQISLLKKGLKFTPTPKANPQDLERDMREFCRRLRLKEFFHADDSNDDDEDGDISLNSAPLVRNKSSWTPKNKRNAVLDNTIDTLHKATKNPPTTNVKENLPKKERKALKELINNDDIIIKEADKGGAICLMDKSFYRDKIMDMLKDESTYKQTNLNNSQITLKIKKLIQKYADCLLDDEKDYLLNFDIKTSNIYGLPKIHKSKLVQQAILEQNSDVVTIISPKDLKFRPIIAGPAAPTSRLSHLIDLILKDLPPTTESFVRDDIHFLSRIQRSLDPNQNYQLVTLDVESLYTNINHQLGLKAIKFWLQKLRDKINPRFTNDFILDSIELILSNNIFSFDQIIFLQTKGTAMGTKMAPTYANLTLAYLEEILYVKLVELKDQTYATYIKNNLLRYLDDCFIIWPKEWDLEEFTTFLNELHTDINFTKDCSDHEIPFLDILVYMVEGNIKTTIFYKTTDSHQYLHYNSCHPRHTKNSIPYAQARRLCTIIDDCEKLEFHLQEMKQFFLDRKYPKRLIEDGIKKAKAIPKSVLRTVKDRPRENILPYVHTYNPHNPNLVPVVKSSIQLLNTNNRMKSVLSDCKYVTSYRQPPNIKNLLTKAAFHSKRTNECGSYKCGDKRCGTCAHIIECDKVKITSTGREFKIRSLLCCKSKNVLYLITCLGCCEQYVGMTNDTLAARMRVHRQHINTPKYRKLGVSRHIAECASDSLKFNVVPFFKLNESKTEGLVKEDLFIQQFNPKLNKVSL